MKKLIIFLLALMILFTNSMYSKFIWQQINSIERDILLIDSLNFFIVGDKGKILRSYDGGVNWEWQESLQRRNLLSISFIDLNNGFISADSGYVISTTNSGKTWKTQKVGNENFYAIKMIDMKHIIVAGEKGTIYASYDNGTSWKLVYKNDSTTLKKLKFINAQNGFAVGENNIILKTIDGGESWNSLFPYHKNYMLSSVDFFDLQYGVVGGFDSLSARSLTYKTSDGGITWDTVKFDFWANWLGAKMYSRQKVLLFCYYGTIVKTEDFFNTFNSELPTTKDYIDVFPKPASIRSISALSNGIIFCIGSNHILAKSNDYGKNFKIIKWFDMTKPPGSIFMSGMVFLNDRESLFYGETGHIFKSIDCGTTWNYVYPRDSTKYVLYFANSTLFAHYFKTEKEGFLVGKRQPQLDVQHHTTFTIKTEDGGLSWVATDKIKAHSMSFPNKNTGYAVADSILSKTTDGGETWITKTIFPAKSLMNFWEVDFKTENLGFIHGRQGNYATDDTLNFPYKTAYRVLKTTDGGISFDTIATIGNRKLNACNVYFKNEQKGFVFGKGYDMLVTEDGGKNWSWQKIDTNRRQISSMKFLDVNFGIAGSAMDTVFITTDGGKNWISERVPAKSGYDTITSFSHIEVKNKDTIFLFGYNTLIRGVNYPDSTDNIDESVNQYNPYFFISINPNPVLSTVKFKLFGLYSVKNSYLNFKILDILGNEVMDLSNLANENNDGKTSEFTCNISSLHLGIYIIKLSSNGYIYVSKLIKT